MSSSSPRISKTSLRDLGFKKINETDYKSPVGDYYYDTYLKGVYINGMNGEPQFILDRDISDLFDLIHVLEVLNGTNLDLRF
ncbi:hypothetical protein HZ996_03195 [Cryomorphaceae bacterium]|nr:hypothetical protein HZ996_03195 [Cryomorphaceae bacterium]